MEHMSPALRSATTPLAPDPDKIRIIRKATEIDRQAIDAPLYSLRILRLALRRQFLSYYWGRPPAWKVGVRSFNRKRMLPTFLSLGASRSGTTLLADYIMQHPCVVLPLAKEFAVGAYPTYAELHAQFPSLKQRDEVLDRYGTAITGYCTPVVPNLLFPQMLASIASELDLKFVLILRNPVDRTFAQWRWERHVSRRSEDDPIWKGVPGFDEMMRIEVEAARSFAASGGPILSGARVGGYVQSSIYLPFLKMLNEFWGRDRVLVINADDFFADPPAVARRVYDFLDLPAYDPVELPVRNAGPPGKMKPETRALLQEFFDPLNRELFDFLGEDFGWR
jgi:hypothetical protein